MKIASQCPPVSQKPLALSAAAAYQGVPTKANSIRFGPVIQFGKSPSEAQKKAAIRNEKFWLPLKKGFWKSVGLLEETINYLTTLSSRLALLSTLIVPMPATVYNFIEQISFFSPLKSCPRERIEDEALRNKLRSKLIPMMDENGKYMEIYSWYVKAKADKPTILFSHGRNSNISHLERYLKPLSEAGYGILAYDYPGFGKSPGRATKKNCYNSGIAAAKYLRDDLKIAPENQILFGYSLGTNVTSKIAAAMRKDKFARHYMDPEIKVGGAQTPKAVVLLNGFPTLSKAFEYQKSKIIEAVPVIPKSWIKTCLDKIFCTEKMQLDLNTEKKLEKVDFKTLILHGAHDKEVSPAQAEAMQQSLRNKNPLRKVDFLELPKSTHTLAAEDTPKMIQALEDFLRPCLSKAV